MFKQNLKSLDINNPSLASILSNFIYKDIEVFQSQSEAINIAYKNELLHSAEDPILEAATIFNESTKNISANSINVVFGLGLGYLFKKVYVSTPGKIILFEPCLDILRFTLEYVDFSNELADKRVYICTKLKEVIQILDNKYIVGDDINISFLPSYTKIYSSMLDDLIKQIISLVESKKMDQGTILTLALHWGNISLRNFENICDAIPIILLKENFNDLPIIIASAGPSLDENIELLKKHRDKYLLITVNTALKALLVNDLVPDFCFVCEMGGIDRQFEGLTGLNKINYILHPRAQQYSWGLSDNKNFVYFAETDGFSTWYNNILNNKYDLLPTAGSVSILAFYTAIKVFKSKNIIVVGQDLAFVNNKAYSDSAMHKNEEFKFENGILKLKTDHKIRQTFFDNLKFLTVKNNQGEDILTRKDYYEYVYQYEDIIKNELSDDITIINTSLKGAKIKGMIYKPLSEALESFQTVNLSVRKRIEDINFKFNHVIEENKLLTKPYIKQFFTHFKVFETQLKELITIAENYKTICKKDINDKRLPILYKDYYFKKHPLSDFIHKEELLSFMLQKAHLKFVNTYIIPSNTKPLSSQDYMTNMKTEMELLKELSTLCIIIENSRKILKEQNAELYEI